MVSHPNRGKKKEGANPTPEAVRAFRRMHGLSAAQAAALVHTSPRAWLQWEEEAQADGARRMHPQTWELAHIKQRLADGGAVTASFIRSIWEETTAGA